MKIACLLLSWTLLWTKVIAAKRKIFIDNDGSAALNLLLPLLGDMEILGISASFGDPSWEDSLGQWYTLLKNYSMVDCIPLYGGASRPLIRTKESFELWEAMYGEFVWKGGFEPYYRNQYDLDKIKYNDTLPAAMALVNAVKQNPGEIEIYAGGLLTTVAQALDLYPKLAQEAASLWLMGGYTDFQYVQSTGNNHTVDVFTDFNLMMDPESANKVLTSNWSSLYIAANVTNYVYSPECLYDKLMDKFGPLNEMQNHTELDGLIYYINTYYPQKTGGKAESVLPIWDEMVSGIVAFPEMVEGGIEVAVAVDTAFNSPFYGNLRMWNFDLAPKKGSFGKAHLVTEINTTMLFDKIYDAFTLDWNLFCKCSLNGTKVPPLSTK